VTITRSSTRMVLLSISVFNSDAISPEKFALSAGNPTTRYFLRINAVADADG